MDRLVVAGFVFAWGLAEVRAQARARRARGGSPASVDRGSLVALYTAIAFGYSLAFAASFAPYGRLPAGQPLWLLVGAVCVAGGLWTRRRAMAALAGAFTYRVAIIPGHRLVESGPYRHLRHPAYSGQLLVLLGVGVALASWLAVVALMTPVLVAFLWRIRVEEEVLRAEFGESFDAYARRTRRLVPGLW